MSLPQIIKSVECPAEGCLATEKPLGRLRENSMLRHWKSKVAILQEGPEPLPWCDQCGMHMMVDKIFKHSQLYKCHKSTEKRFQRRDVDMEERCEEMELSMEGG